MHYCDNCADLNCLPKKYTSTVVEGPYLCLICFEKKDNHNYIDDMEYFRLKTFVEPPKVEEETYSIEFINREESDIEQDRIYSDDISEAHTDMPSSIQ